MKRTPPNKYVRHSLTIVLAQLFCWVTGDVHAQNFAPPGSAQKYSFYPQAGNFFGDLWPNNFVDLDTTAGIRAYNGSDYTYDGHRGIDTEIKGFAAQAVGVPVFAALDGTVIEAHDGEFDMNTQSGNQPVNYVKIDHGNGQTTTYFHLKKNSVAVTVGQHVVAGEQIGLTGSSGSSTAPHLHFQSEVNGAVYEPFAGSARPGDSGWTSQPPFRTDVYLREIVLTNQNLGSWQGYPFDTTRTGTFLTGVQSVGVWFTLCNGESISNFSGRYIRPDGSVALTTQTFNILPYRQGIWAFYYFVNLDVTGNWKLQILLNGQLFTEAHFTVVSSGPIVNHPPGAIEAVIDPPAPASGNVIFCRITSPTLYLDPDYDLVRFHYLWKMNNTVVRDVVSAGLADAIPRNTIPVGATVTCTVTPSDGVANGPSATVGPITVLQLSPTPTGPAAAVDFTTIGSTTNSNQVAFSLGYAFTPTADIQVAALGYYDAGQNGFIENHDVAIFDAITKVVMVDTLVTNGDPLQGLFRYHSVAPVTLVANHPYFIMGATSNDSYTSTTPPVSYTSSPLLTHLGGAINNSPPTLGAAFPTQSGVPIQFGPTFQIVGAPHLTNLSTRAQVQTGAAVTIAGFIIDKFATGSNGSLKVVVRGLGPTLGDLGVSGFLQNPILELHQAGAQGDVLLATNDNWKQTQQAVISSTGKAPKYDSEAAMLVDLPKGSYTAILRGVGGQTGVGLVEVYGDVGGNWTGEILRNISTRGYVGSGAQVLIGGFIVPANYTHVVVRGLGPTLTQLGVPNVLADPVLALVNGNGTVIASNDNWRNGQPGELTVNGYAPPSDFESAIYTTVSAGNYTAILSGKNNGTGTALVEVYYLP